MRTANLAIVFTDIQGFTERTSRQTLEENQRLLQVHASLLTPLFRGFGGRIV
ncbi:MAG TPA: adenylate/guanylate cyclase domain-containing protein, partial [Aggregicoccus sp.]|nr:adenylate/guanylate cyclase domain-containing protein [Aggregicoccus sp.]